MPQEPKKAFSFASLLGFGPKASAEAPDDEMQGWEAKAETDERYQRKAEESDDDYKKRCQALDAGHEEPDGDEQAAAAAQAAADHGEALQAVAAAAEANERQRCARIVAHGIQIGAAEQAGVFAFDTGMSADAAIAALDAGQTAAQARADAAKPTPRQTLQERMAAQKIPKVQGEAGGADPDSPESFAQAVLAAGRKARGEA